MTYRAKHITQRDGSAHQWENCRMAAGATMLDYTTEGGKTSTGAEMRSRQQDQSGGTDAYDLQRAWGTYHETLIIRNGHYWAKLLEDRAKGWFVSVDVWYAEIDREYRCQDNGAIGHTIGIAPEDNGPNWLMSDPLCSGYKWTPADQIRRGAEEYGRRQGTGTAIHYTTAEAVLSSGSAVDMAISAASNLTSSYGVDVKDGQSWFLDANLRERGGSFSSDARVKFIGNPIGEAQSSKAVLISTGVPYSDNQPRPTIAYLDAQYADPTPDPVTPGPDCPDCPDCPPADEIIASRDAVWVAHLTPEPPGKTV